MNDAALPTDSHSRGRIGAQETEHFYEALIDGGASAVLAASLFHFGEYQISEVKNYLRERGVAVR